MIGSQALVRKSAASPQHEPEAEPKPIGELAARIIRRLAPEGGR